MEQGRRRAEVAAGGGGGGGGNYPSSFTTWVGNYVANSTAPPSYTGGSVTLPIGVNVPGGVSNLQQLTVFLSGPGGYTAYGYLEPSGAGYGFWMVDSLGNSSGWLALTASGQTTAASLSMNGLQVTATQLNVTGTVMLFNLTLAQSGTFSYQVALAAVSSGGYSLPWSSQVAAQWANGGAVSLSPATFPTAENVGTASGSVPVTLTNSGNVAITINSITSTGTNPDDFSIRSDECPSSLAAGAYCTVTVVFEPSASGTRNSSLVVQYGSPGTQQSTTLTGTGVGAEQVPTVLTTYVDVFGDPAPAYNGQTVMLPLRVYVPAGPNTLGYLQTSLNAAGGYNALIYLFQNNGAYTLDMIDNQGRGSGSISLTANGQTTAAALTMGSLQITATRLAVVGNEVQLDLTMQTSGTFSYQASMAATAVAGYSVPWGAVAATWGN